MFFFFFFQAEDGIRDGHVTGFRRVLFRSLAGELVDLVVFIARVPVDLLLKGRDVEDLEIAIVGLALLYRVDILAIECETVEIGKFGWRTDFVERLYVEVYLIL